MRSICVSEYVKEMKNDAKAQNMFPSIVVTIGNKTVRSSRCSMQRRKKTQNRFAKPETEKNRTETSAGWHHLSSSSVDVRVS